MMSDKKAVIYLRVSTEIQVDGYSLAAQLHSIETYANAYAIKIVETYEDKGKSGKSIESRPEFLKMLEAIESKSIDVDYVLVFKLSRFGRNAADTLNSLQRLQDYGVNLCCTEDKLDSSTGSGKLMIAVLSAVAEIERVNIVEQTMAGRRQKARDGKWNGGFAPYGYRIGEDDVLQIEDSEVEVIRLMFEKFTTTDLGYTGVTKYLNRQGIKKLPRQNGKLTHWTPKLVASILDNPIYNGLMPYGRRIKEKVDGTRDDYHQVKQKDYPIYDGLHKAIIDDDIWEQTRDKRAETGVKSPSRIGRDRAHLLSGILRCPECGSGMYTNRNSWERKDGTEVERYYYACSRTKSERGTCTYKATLREDAIESEVISAVRALVKNPLFAKDIKQKIGTQIDTTEIDVELKNYDKALKQCEKSKDTLEQEIDTMPLAEPHRERKLQDKNKRLNRFYDELYELEEKIADLIKKRKAVESNALNLEQVYQMLLNFDLLYSKLTDTEQRDMVSYIIKEVEIHKLPEETESIDIQQGNGATSKKKSKRKKETSKNISRLKSITFQFPVKYGDDTGNRILWDNESTVETCIG